jgi:hypothetical protein
MLGNLNNKYKVCLRKDLPWLQDKRKPTKHIGMCTPLVRER